MCACMEMSIITIATCNQGGKLKHANVGVEFFFKGSAKWLVKFPSDIISGYLKTFLLFDLLANSSRVYNGVLLMHIAICIATTR